MVNDHGQIAGRSHDDRACIGTFYAIELAERMALELGCVGLVVDAKAATSWRASPFNGRSRR